MHEVLTRVLSRGAVIATAAAIALPLLAAVPAASADAAPADGSAMTLINLNPAAPALPTAPTPPEWSILTGEFFDACAAPSKEAMKAWRQSPYVGVGVYVSGISRSCKQPNLTPDWVRSVSADSWALIPIHVGPQAPCAVYRKNGKLVKFPHKIGDASGGDMAFIELEARMNADEAVAAMSALGFGPGNPIYLDMEAWPATNTGCTNITLEFVHHWTKVLHEHGYISGFYSSGGSGIKVLAERAAQDPTFIAPDAVWTARWDGVPDTNERFIDMWPGLWEGATRLKQYRGGHNEKWGGVTINIDSNYANGPVARLGLDAGPTALQRVSPGTDVKIQLTAAKGNAPYHFAETDWALPPGLTLSDSGVVTGRTYAGGYTNSIVEVTDSSNPPLGVRFNLNFLVSYSDVPGEHEFFPTVSWLMSSRITAGYDDGTFRPINSVSRGQMAAFLYRYLHDGKGAPECTSSPFKDVHPDTLFCGHIQWLADTKITSGYEDGKFYPDRPVTRGQMAAFLYRVFQRQTGEPWLPECTTTPKKLKDIDPDYQFCTHITWLVNSGITVGYDDSTYRPTNPVTRGAMSAFLQRLDREIGKKTN